MRTFYQVLGNTLVATITTIIAWFAITFWAYLQTNSVIVTTVMALMFIGGNLATAFLFGSLADRYDKRKLMMVADALTALLFAVALGIYASTPPEVFTSVTSPQLWLLISVVFVAIIIPNIRNIIQATLVPILVPEDRLDRANGLAGISGGISMLIGSIFSGLLVAGTGMYWVLALPIVVRGLTILHLMTLRFPSRVAAPAALDDSIDAPAAASTFDLRATYRLVRGIPGLMGLLFFTCLNNFLGGVFMPLMDPYGLSMMSVEAWGILSGILGLGFIAGGAIVVRRGLGPNPLRTLFIANLLMWGAGALFTVQPSILFLAVGFFMFPFLSPFAEAAEHTIIQRVVPADMHGRVFGFAQSIEQSASPVSTLLAGPLAQFVFIPFMTTGGGVALIGEWFGTGEARGIALVFTLAGVVGIAITFFAMRSRTYRLLSNKYAESVQPVESVQPA